MYNTGRYRAWLAALLLPLWVALTMPAHALNALPPSVLDVQTDDLDGIAKRRTVRALVAWSKTGYFIDKGQQRGINLEVAREFEKFLNTRLKTGKQPMAVVLVPVSRDKLISYLAEGRGDIALAGLSMTPSRREKMDFSVPIHEHVNEIIVRHKLAPQVRSLVDLAGKTVYLRPSSSYFESLQQMNSHLRGSGHAPVKIMPLDEHLADEDILEMMNAGLIDYTILDDFRASFWARIFTDVVLDKDAAVARDLPIAYGLRKNTPKLKALLDEFLKNHRIGSMYGNVLAKRYFNDNIWARSALNPNSMASFQKTVSIFKHYSDTYHFDYLMLTAQGYQESGLDQKQRSHVGAIGVMQVMPATGREMKVGDIRKLDPNIHAGVKYMSQLSRVYFNEPELDDFNRTLFCFAGYNAGPNRIARLRKVAQERGLNPNIWFDNVERVVAEKVSQETVQYVLNISKYYYAYKLVEENEKRRAQAIEALEKK